MNLQQQILACTSADRIVEQLRPFLTERRQERIETVIAGRLASLQVALESPYDPHNAAAVIRNCEGFGLQYLHIIAADNPNILSPGVTQGSHSWVTIQKYKELADFSAAMSTDFRFAAACVDGEVELAQVPVDKPICLLMGNEHRGLTDSAKQMCDIKFKIPMFGMSESFNLSVSTGICIYELARARRQFLQRNSDLDDHQQHDLRAEYYLKSVEPRVINHMFLSKENLHASA